MNWIRFKTTNLCCCYATIILLLWVCVAPPFPKLACALALWALDDDEDDGNNDCRWRSTLLLHFCRYNHSSPSTQGEQPRHLRNLCVFAYLNGMSSGEDQIPLPQKSAQVVAHTSHAVRGSQLLALNSYTFALSYNRDPRVNSSDSISLRYTFWVVILEKGTHNTTPRRLCAVAMCKCEWMFVCSNVLVC